MPEIVDLVYELFPLGKIYSDNGKTKVEIHSKNRNNRMVGSFIQDRGEIKDGEEEINFTQLEKKINIHYNERRKGDFKWFLRNKDGKVVQEGYKEPL